jgi:hypothetical protein
LVELVLRVGVGEPLLVSLGATVVEGQTGSVLAKKLVLLIACEEIGISPEERAGLWRNAVGVNK